ncbi:cbb3-type cytochrome oxidase assembly protein CcoS [Thiomicrorhabdus aquaedulcis]|uniref:cbb3-type cytochrome oxidase assembly protein CcoS n=1 Tax=Thiomicrorhabdus aquaedulcis TaxID=2211106 RepID=UPI000FDB1799|nr:cbb3-type cytochrome oxidase assembly protein CcoS [Thiomicrorhabdus aquaedulcis]
MDVIYGLIPMMLIFGFLVVVVFIWMAKSGQFDDMDGAANRIFMEDEYPKERSSNASNATKELKPQETSNHAKVSSGEEAHQASARNEEDLKK